MASFIIIISSLGHIVFVECFSLRWKFELMRDQLRTGQSDAVWLRGGGGYLRNVPSNGTRRNSKRKQKQKHHCQQELSASTNGESFRTADLQGVWLPRNHTLGSPSIAASSDRRSSPPSRSFSPRGEQTPASLPGMSSSFSLGLDQSPR